MTSAPTTDLDQPVYPMPAPADEARFTFGLLIDVARVLADHGYAPVRAGLDLGRLQQALFHFLYRLPEGDQYP